MMYLVSVEKLQHFLDVGAVVVAYSFAVLSSLELMAQLKLLNYLVLSVERDIFVIR